MRLLTYFVGESNIGMTLEFLKIIQVPFLPSFVPIHFIGVVLPDAPITTVLRKDSSSFTYTIMASFSKFTSDWLYTPHTTWPQEIIVIIVICSGANYEGFTLHLHDRR